MSHTIRIFSTSAKHRAVEQARLILAHTHESAGALLKAFNLARSQRSGGGAKGTGGMTTDEEQDILRAMLVMAAAGLDSMTKQLIRDTLPLIIRVNDRAREGLEKYVARQFANDIELANEGRASRFVASLLSSQNLPDRAANEYVRHLTSGSMQSAEELLKIAAAFGLTRDQVKTDFQSLKEIFEVRNKIIHELDINLQGTRRKRNIRSRDDLVSHANALLAAADDLLRAIDQELTSKAA